MLFKKPTDDSYQKTCGYPYVVLDLQYGIRRWVTVGLRDGFYAIWIVWYSYVDSNTAVNYGSWS